MPRRKEFDLHLFTVEGSGSFPFDMLRYDACWPYSEGHDSGRLAPPPGEVFGRRRVVLATRCANSPTPARWESFLWRVVGDGEIRQPPAAGLRAEKEAS